MRIKNKAVWICVALIMVAAAPMWAQGGPGGPRGRGPQGFGWGPEDGVRFMGMGGCLFGERGPGEKASAAYALTVQRVDLRPILGPPPSTTTHTDNYSIFRDANGVTYLETTRNSKTLVCINDPANHERYVVDLTSPNAGTAVEFKLPQGKGPRPPRGDAGNGQNPPWNGKANPNLTRVIGATSAQIQNYVTSPPGSWFSACTGLDLTAMRRGQFQNVRIFCSSLGALIYIPPQSILTERRR